MYKELYIDLKENNFFPVYLERKEIKIEKLFSQSSFKNYYYSVIITTKRRQNTL